MLKIIQRLGTAYAELLRTHPLRVQSIQTGFLLGTGDVISQAFVEKDHYNAYRTMRFALVGVALGPALLGWYKTLDYVVGKSSYPVAKKVALDQLIAAPSFLLVVQVAVCISQRMTFEEIKEKLNHHYFDILWNNYKVWPVVQAVNFSIIPLDYRVLFTQVIAIFWNTYLAYKTHQSVKKPIE